MSFSADVRGAFRRGDNDAVVRMSETEIERARAGDLYRASMALNEELGQPETVNSELHNLAFCELGRGRLDTARELFATSRERVFREGWDTFVPYVGVAGAALASAEGDHRRAALMAGVAEGAFAALGQVPDPDDAKDLAAVSEAARAALGDEAFQAERERGRRLDPRAAFDAD